MAQLTAIEWFFKQTVDRPWKEVFEEAKQMEKEQIQKAFSDGQEIPINHPTLPHYSGEEYYNDTYKK